MVLPLVEKAMYQTRCYLQLTKEASFASDLTVCVISIICEGLTSNELFQLAALLAGPLVASTSQLGKVHDSFPTILHRMRFIGALKA